MNHLYFGNCLDGLKKVQQAQLKPNVFEYGADQFIFIITNCANLSSPFSHLFTKLKRTLGDKNQCG